MKPTNIKPTNLIKIIALIEGNGKDSLQGSQLEAFYSLIQQKGEPIATVGEKHEINGLKCLLLPNNQYVAIKHYPTKKDSFYPCRIRTHLLTEIPPEQ